MVSWHGSVVLRTLLRLKELVRHLELRGEFCDRFKNRARHLFRTSQRRPRSPQKPRLLATACKRTTHGFYQLYLAVASRGTLAVLYATHRRARHWSR